MFIQQHMQAVHKPSLGSLLTQPTWWITTATERQCSYIFSSLGKWSQYEHPSTPPTPCEAKARQASTIQTCIYSRFYPHPPYWVWPRCFCHDSQLALSNMFGFIACVRVAALFYVAWWLSHNLPIVTSYEMPGTAFGRRARTISTIPP